MTETTGGGGPSADARNDWLDALPIARWGVGELAAVAGLALIGAIALGLLGPPWCWAAVLPVLFAAYLAWFYRDPAREVPADPAAFLSPADGKVVDVSAIEHDEFLGGPATRIGIFLSVFDVHINRAPRAARVVATDYRPGAHRNTLFADSADRNEHQWIGFEEAQGRRHTVRQIAGLLARRIVCELAPGVEVRGGQKFGMIKFGSRTELVVPADVEVVCQPGDRVRAGETILARVATDG